VPPHKSLFPQKSHWKNPRYKGRSGGKAAIVFGCDDSSLFADPGGLYDEEILLGAPKDHGVSEL